MAKILWQPDKKQIESAQVTGFRRRIIADFEIDLADYPALYEWSLKHSEAFWSALWDDAGVIAETKGDTLLEQGELMPGAQWFPEARLNFAENLLRRRDESDAIVFWGEDKVRRRLSYEELYAQVSLVAQALEGMGITEGDRVAGYLPNMPEAVIAMLAAAALGATWSSCSPDFGSNGVVDRFGQIEPKVLFCAEGYYYNGKTFDCLEKV
ncbi:MAG: AMP-binding protein, partial [Sedimenticola sp.]